MIHLQDDTTSQNNSISQESLIDFWNQKHKSLNIDTILAKTVKFEQDNIKNTLSLTNNLFEFATLNACFIVSNNGENDWFAIYNNQKEVFKVSQNFVTSNVTLNAEKIVTTRLISKELDGLVMQSNQPNIKKLGVLENLIVNDYIETITLNAKNITAEFFDGYVKKEHQPYIKSLGTLENLHARSFVSSDVGFRIGDARIVSKDSTLVVENLNVDNLNVKNLLSSKKVIAEYFVTDKNYEVGTVLDFGGLHEVTLSKTPNSTAVAGIVVSPMDAVVLNSSAKSSICIGVSGITVCKLVGQARKGSLLVSAGDGTAKVEFDPKPGTVIGKSLMDFYGTEGIILVKLMSA